MSRLSNVEEFDRLNENGIRPLFIYKEFRLLDCYKDSVLSHWLIVDTAPMWYIRLTRSEAYETLAILVSDNCDLSVLEVHMTQLLQTAFKRNFAYEK